MVKPLPSTRQIAKNTIERLIVTILVSLGVSPTLSRKMAPYIIKVIVIFLSFSLIFTVAIFAGSISGQRVASTEAFEELDSEVVAVVTQYATANQIPSRLLLGIAKAQTNLGTTSPYDLIDRSIPLDGVLSSVYPNVSPSIGDAGIKGQGLGMYLIRQDSVDSFDPQNWDSATEFLSRESRRIADDLIASGLDEPISDPLAADLFWQKVVDELPLVDTITGDVGCVVPADISLPNRIQILFDCELRKINRLTIRDIRLGPAGTFVEDKITGTLALNTLVGEALGVAWLWGSRSGADTWQEVQDIPCSISGGIFPLTSKQVRNVNDEDRCNPDTNIIAAAQILGKDLSEARNRSSNSPFIDITAAGWASLNSLIPNKGGVLARFTSDGPFQPFRPTGACSELTRSWLFSLTGNEYAQPFANLSINSNESNLSTAYVSFNAEGIGAPRKNPLCNDPLTGKPTNVSSFLDYVGFLALTMMSEIQSGSSVSSEQLSPEIDGIIVLSEKRSIPPLAKWGETSAIERLSPDRLLFEVPFFQRIPSTGGPASLGARSIGNAIVYGGLVRGDDRAGTYPAIGSGIGGIGIAMERFDASAYNVFDQAAGSPMIRIDCGANGIPHYGLSIIVERWEVMCQSALSDGIKLQITSSYRTNELQQKLADAAKGLPYSRVAKPGTSRHQKGIALDLWLGSQDGIAQDLHPQYAWLHTVVGCYNSKEKSYSPLPSPVLSTEYAKDILAGTPKCKNGMFAVKRAQTFGLVPFCLLSPLSGSETLLDEPAIACRSGESDIMKESVSRQIREPWHFDVGIIVSSISNSNSFANVSGCEGPSAINPSDKRSVAIAIKSIWYCILASEGFTSLPPRQGNGEYKERDWFSNYAQQISAEAVVVAFCESGLDPSASPGKPNRGVFQMSNSELESFGVRSELWNDAALNITAAARYFVSEFNKNTLYEGWGPWASVNTQRFGKTNSYSFPVIGRFPASPPSLNAGDKSGLALPNWAIDPEKYWGPTVSCKTAVDSGIGFNDANLKALVK
jgi:hypothetical protein